MEKQPVSLYRHTIADICILVNPSTKEIIPQQSSQVLEYMQTNHAQDSIQSLIDDKVLVLVGGSSVRARASLVTADKTTMKDPKVENENLGKSQKLWKFLKLPKSYIKSAVNTQINLEIRNSVAQIDWINIKLSICDLKCTF